LIENWPAGYGKDLGNITVYFYFCYYFFLKKSVPLHESIPPRMILPSMAKISPVIVEKSKMTDNRRTE
jgi:hypothetical protein